MEKINNNFNNENKRLAIIMLGAPGSGKGTQGEILEKHTGFKRYVISDLIKKESKPKSEISNKIAKGELLANDDIFRIFRKNFKSEEQIILDGIPRTLDQAYWLYGFLIKHNYDMKLIFLNVNEKKLLKRITSRFYCPICHRVYNILTNKPKVEGICDFDSSKLIQREDDTPKIFKSRLATFDEIKEVILKVYSGDIININADQTIENVSSEMIRKIILR